MKIVELGTRYALRKWSWSNFSWVYLGLINDTWYKDENYYARFYYSSPHIEIIEKRIKNYKK